MRFISIGRSCKIILLGVLVLSSMFALNQSKLSRYFPIETVRVYGVSHIDHHAVETMLAPLLTYGFFSVNVDSMRERLLQLPWVADLNVRRIWPNQVEVIVVEKNPLALWNKTSLLSEGGELFSPSRDTYPSGLPELHGPIGQQITMLHFFKEINRILLPIHAKIAYLELTPYLTWKVTLDNGILLQLGHKEILTRLAHFVKVYPQIVGDHVQEVAYVDLRYPKGVAVKFKREDKYGKKANQ